MTETRTTKIEEGLQTYLTLLQDGGHQLHLGLHVFYKASLPVKGELIYNSNNNNNNNYNNNNNDDDDDDSDYDNDNNNDNDNHHSSLNSHHHHHHVTVIISTFLWR